MQHRTETIEVNIPLEALPDQQFLAACYVMDRLRAHGIPVVGPVGVIGVETGRITLSMEYDGEESLCYRWTGIPLPQYMRKHQFTLEKTHAQLLAEENDL